MSFKTFYTALVIALALAGCGRSDEERNIQRQEDQDSLKSPRFIGTLPNGQTISRITLHNTPDGYAHYIYFTDNVTTANLNYDTRSGKVTTHHHEVYVQINGRPILLEEAKKAIEDAEKIESKKKSEEVEVP